jgi:excisionase family DNA binding protein
MSQQSAQSPADWRQRDALTVEEAGRILGIGRWASYAAAKSGELPTIRIGKRLIVPRVGLERLLAGEV